MGRGLHLCQFPDQHCGIGAGGEVEGEDNGRHFRCKRESTKYIHYVTITWVKFDFEVKKKVYKPHQHRSLLSMVRITYTKSANI